MGRRSELTSRPLAPSQTSFTGRLRSSSPESQWPSIWLLIGPRLIADFALKALGLFPANKRSRNHILDGERVEGLNLKQKIFCSGAVGGCKNTTRLEAETADFRCVDKQRSDSLKSWSEAPAESDLASSFAAAQKRCFNGFPFETPILVRCCSLGRICDCVLARRPSRPAPL